MQTIDQDLVVKVGELEFVFEEPSLNDWATIAKMEGTSLDQQADALFPKLKELRGESQYKDGTLVTLESVKEKKLPARVFLQIVKGWSQGVVAGLKGEADAKNG